MPSNTLTRFRSGITILTERVANTLFGGLYGQPEAVGLDPEDPLVAGHIHDGQHLDGHAQKINLSDHVTGQLDGANIQDGTISSAKLIFSSGLNILLTNDGRVIVDDNGIILTQ